MPTKRRNHSGIEHAYRQRTPKSAEMMQRAAKAMPGGNTRTTTFHAPYPVVFERGTGAWLTDLDGHRYVDVFNNGLSLIHGHAYDPVREMAAQVMPHGTAWAGASRYQVEFAELLQARIPGGGLVRFTNDGSEAGMLAAQIARRATGRPLLLKFKWAYHGSFPDLEAGLYGQGEIAGRTVLAEFNDLASCERAMQQHGDQIAAVFYEPVMYTGRVVPAAKGFLNALEKLARKRGILTIMDDCLMFRLAVGGSSERYDLKPDLVALGKFIGGGTPVGAVVGRKELLALLDPREPGCMFHGGSFNGNVLGCALGLVAMQGLTAAAIDRMGDQTRRITESWRNKASSLGIDVTITSEGSVAGLAFAADPARHEDDPAGLGIAKLFHLACLNEGIAMGPVGLLALSTAIDEPAMAHLIRGWDKAFDAITEVIDSRRT